jgi:hypothetical protein
VTHRVHGPFGGPGVPAITAEEADA